MQNFLDSAQIFLLEKADYIVAHTDQEILIYVIFGVLFLGIGLGLKKKTVIFYDYDDMAFSLGIFIAPIAMMFILMVLQPANTTQAVIIMSIPSAVLFWLVLKKTWKSGVRWTFPLVLYTKFFLSIFYVVAIWKLMAPDGDTRGERRIGRTIAFFFLLFATPLIAALVQNKQGMFFNAIPRGGSGGGMIRNMMR